MNIKYIDASTYEIVENPNFFEVDDLIAETISILNKKGYKTAFSCSGHNDKTCYKIIGDIEFLEQAKKDPMNHIGKISQNNFEYYRETESTQVYIKFDKHYNFDTLPKDFEYESAEQFAETIASYQIPEENKSQIIYGDIIEKIIHFFNNAERNADDEIQKEIEKANTDLLEWAKKLPNHTQNTDLDL